MSHVLYNSLFIVQTMLAQTITQQPQEILREMITDSPHLKEARALLNNPKALRESDKQYACWHTVVEHMHLMYFRNSYYKPIDLNTLQPVIHPNVIMRY